MSIPPSTRESVMTALLAKLTPLSPNTFPTVSRKLRMWDDVGAEQQPALFMVEHTEKALAVPRGLPRKAEWDVMLFIYARADGEGTVGATTLNNLLDAVEAALGLDPGTAKTTPNNVLTLNGTVYRIWAEGDIIKDPGDLEGQCLALYPIKIRPP